MLNTIGADGTRKPQPPFLASEEADMHLTVVMGGT
eukprot:XP_001709104.1 Hypothetical protein GL50803_27655 [Giardia lamblia ATCC 50803]